MTFPRLSRIFILILVLVVCTRGYRFNIRMLPTSNKAYSADEWAHILEKVRPRTISDQNFKPIVQTVGAGRLSVGIKPLIIGGSAAVLGQFPWQALVVNYGIGSCGGSLILENWILTAAHCTEGGSRFVITLGSIDKTNPSPGYIQVESTEAFNHPAYDKDAISNDIALIKLPQKITLTDNIKLVALPLLANLTSTFEGINANLSGFGRLDDTTFSNNLQHVVLTVIPLQDCAIQYPGDILDSNICTSTPSKASCKGDSGGPLVYKDNDGIYRQIGIVSFGSSKGCLAKPSVYARVTYYMEWMSKIIGQDLIGTSTTTSTTSTSQSSTSSPPSTSSVSTSTKASILTATPTNPTSIFVPRPQHKVNCAFQNFESLKKCCNTDHGDLFPVYRGDMTSAGCSGKPASFKIFNSYYLNKQQNSRASNLLSFSDGKLGKFFAKDACFVNCYLAAKGAMFPNGTVNEEALLNLMIPNQKVRWAAIFNASVSSCKAVINKLSIPTFSNGRFSCPGSAAMFMQCIQLKMYGSCSSFDSNASCVKSRGNWLTCAEPIVQALTGSSGTVFSAGRLAAATGNEYENVAYY